MMVRINLLPSKKRASGGGVPALYKVGAVMALLFIAQIVAMYIFYSDLTEEREAIRGEVATAEQSITKLTAEVGSLETIEAKARELESREAALKEKALRRVGPQYLLDELKRILSLPSTRPAIKAARKSGWNVAWEASNVFLTSFNEVGGDNSGNGAVEIVGDARTLDDVAEFWLRMRTSDYFRNVRLGGITERRHSELEEPLQHFTFSANVNLYYYTEQGIALARELEQAGTEPGDDPDGGDATATDPATAP